MNESKLESFVKALDREWGWRKKELIYYNQAMAVVDKYQENTIARAGILLLYAHWEGFIKISSQKFLKCFANESLQLVPKYIIAAHLSQVSEDIAKKYSKHQRMFQILDSLNEKALVSPSINAAIDTRSNLNAEALKDIVTLVGVDFALFETRAQFINYSFVALRNKIAHGEGQLVTKDDFTRVLNDVTELLTLFKENIINSARCANGFLTAGVCNSCLKLI